MFKGNFCWRNCMDDSTMTDSLFTHLPTEILIKIFQYLDFYDIQSVRLCCKKWFAVTKLPEFDSKGVFKIISSHLDCNHPAAEVIFEKRIEKLYIKSVQFGDVDKLFRHIGTSLKVLTLKLVPITTALRLTLEHFPNLQTLRICKIKLPILIDDIEHLPFGNFAQLKELQLTANEASVNKYILSSALDTPTLEKLTVEFSQKEETEVLRVLEKHSSSLKRLDLRFYEGRHLQDLHWMNAFAKINLTELSLRGSFCSQILVSATEGKSSMRFLNLTGSVAVDDDYIILVSKQLTSLERLYLAYCGRVTDLGAKELVKLTKLKTLNITYCNQITSEGVCQIVGRSVNYNLQELHLQELDMEETDICYISNNLPNLRAFNLSGCNKALTNGVMQEIFKSQRKLRELHLNNCNRLSDSGILGIGTGVSIQDLKCLERLSFRGCRHVTDVTLICGLKLPHLRFLDISHCDAMTNHGLETFVHNCPTLEQICITHNKDMNCEAIRTLTENLGRLRVLIVNNCKDASQIGAINWNQSRFRTFTNEVTLKKYPKPR